MTTKPRKILHLDLDAFFCAVEELHDPSLRGKPFAVGGSPQGRGVVASCSYSARKFGVHSAMPMSRAVRICPDLQIVRHAYNNYVEYSRKVRDIMRSYTELVQSISIDEAFIEVTELPRPAVEYARDMQARIRDELGLPCSLGVATNKLVAKIATNVGKASSQTDTYPNAIQVVPPGQEAAFLAPLPTEALWGVGPKTAEKLAELRLHSIGDIAAYPLAELERRFGEHGRALHRRAQGIDNSPIHLSHETKSVSQEVTYSEDTNDPRQLRDTLKRQSLSVSKRLKKLDLYARTVQIKLRWSDFTTITRQITLQEATDEADLIEHAANKLLDQNWKNRRLIRLIGVGVHGLEAPSPQLSLWDWDPTESAKQEQLDRALKVLNQRFGPDVVRHASDLEADRHAQ
jgi:DNA polymerase-4